MQPMPQEFNPFALMLDPQAVFAQIERSERLERLQRRVCRPLDKPLLGSAGDDAADAADGAGEDAADADLGDGADETLTASPSGMPLPTPLMFAASEGSAPGAQPARQSA